MLLFKFFFLIFRRAKNVFLDCVGNKPEIFLKIVKNFKKEIKFITNLKKL